jgi:hypothetical protein
VRLALAALLFFYPESVALRLVFAMMALGFAWRAVFGSNSETQLRRVFWHGVRWVHAVLLGMAAVCPAGYVYALLDVAFSVTYRLVTKR